MLSESTVLGWLTKRREYRMLRRFGGLQWCPWCKQCAQNGDGWFFQRWERDTMLDVLTCGVCAGTSLWKWEIGFIYVGALEPPTPSVPSWDVYDVANACLKRPVPPSPTAGVKLPPQPDEAREGSHAAAADDSPGIDQSPFNSNTEERRP